MAPAGAEEPTMDLQKLPLGIDVADPEDAELRGERVTKTHEWYNG